MLLLSSRCDTCNSICACACTFPAYSSRLSRPTVCSTSPSPPCGPPLSHLFLVSLTCCSKNLRLVLVLGFESFAQRRREIVGGLEMAGRYDRNPFEQEEEEVNPFSDPVVRAQAAKPSYGGGGLFNDPVSNSRLSPLPHEPAFSGVNDATVDIPLGAGKDLKKKEKELKAKEEELRRKEQDLKRREEAAERAGIRIEKKNWPPFINILHHDIANDIPAHSRGLQRWAYASWLGILLCLFWNFICVTAAWIAGVGGVSIFLLGIVYVLSGYVLSYFLWYKPLYRAMRSDSVLRFGWFVMFYLLHIAFCVYAAVAPPFIFKGKSLAGIIQAIDIFSSNIIIGIFYVVGFALFTLESLLSIWVLKGVVQYFRGEGAAAEMKRNTAARASRVDI